MDDRGLPLADRTALSEKLGDGVAESRVVDDLSGKSLLSGSSSDILVGNAEIGFHTSNTKELALDVNKEGSKEGNARRETQGGKQRGMMDNYRFRLMVACDRIATREPQ
jgi:hypothetical protein